MSTTKSCRAVLGWSVKAVEPSLSLSYNIPSLPLKFCQFSSSFGGAKTKLNHGKANRRMEKKSQHQGSSWFEKETQLQPMQLLNCLGVQPEKAQAYP